MIKKATEITLFDIQKRAEYYLANNQYAEAISYYEGAIESQPDNKYYYWYLGLMLLLKEQEEDAQMTWLLAMADGESPEIELWNGQLVEILNREASRQARIGDYQTAWIIRQHIRELNPTEINNLLRLIYLSAEINAYTEETLSEYGIIELLKQSSSTVEIHQELAILTLDRVLKAAALAKSSFEFTEAIALHVSEIENFVTILIRLVYELFYAGHQPQKAIDFCKVGLGVAPKDSRLLSALAHFCVDLGNYGEAIEYARNAYLAVESTAEKLYQNLVLIKAMLSAGGYWEEVAPLVERHKLLIDETIEENPTNLGKSELLLSLYNSSFYFPYLQDNPAENMNLRQKIGQLCQNNIEIVEKERIKRYFERNNTLRQRSNSTKKPLKIGYISSCLRRHSVGWLARALFQYMDRDRFEIHAYMVASQLFYEPLRDWYVAHCDKAHKYGLVTLEVADQIYEDEIDILIDLDSLTSTTICGILALKPAPIQATWLGLDASEVTAIDYFIADRYVVTENAQEYYQEKIIRLPETYLAIDGFEVSVPTVTRADLEIPDDAVVYLGAQRGPKYNPHIAELQLQILSQVPNSYFIIKGFGEQYSLNRFFFEIAEAQGIARDRIKFLPRVETEEIHRANLQIADIVLDTYPYNGATTTMETLWMEIPMITRVGQQFAARNSYTMMMNAGIAEGIAWTDEEYVEWGIRLGKDEKLRQDIAWKLRKSKQTAPLWNAKQFTREMEKAYEGMWQRYIEGGN